ncbi:MAG: SixA phosphatase family protein [Xanthobacteraceae bacterium]
MRLIIFRHAKAEKGAPGTRDRDRELNPRGHKDARRMGAYMARHTLLPALALVSPARRTRETWDGIAAELPATVPVSFEDRLYDSGAETILAVLREIESEVAAVLVVGHNPSLHESACRLIASGDVEDRERLNEALPTSGLAVIDFAGSGWDKLHPRSGRLERFVTPRLLAGATR